MLNVFKRFYWLFVDITLDEICQFQETHQTFVNNKQKSYRL